MLFALNKTTRLMVMIFAEKTEKKTGYLSVLFEINFVVLLRREPSPSSPCHKFFYPQEG